MTEENGMRIRAARAKAGLTREQVEKEMKIPMRTLQDWELGKRKPPEWAADLVVEKLERIAEGK